MTNSKLPWSKFFWSAWASDPGLRLCSMAAQGFWMRMLCICAESEPVGYLAIAGHPLDVIDLAKVIGVPARDAQEWLDELEHNGVFSRTRKGTIYSRRMVGDGKRRRKNVKNGRLGGNPKLGNHSDNSGSDNHPDKAKRIEDRVKSHNIEDTAETPRDGSAEDEGEKPKATLAAVPDTPAQRVCTEIMRRCQMTRPPADVALVVSWLKAGADPERHILPIVDQMFPKARGGVSSLKYFNTAVLTAIEADRAHIDADIARWSRDAERIADIEAETLAAEAEERARAHRRAENRARYLAEQAKSA